MSRKHEVLGSNPTQTYDLQILGLNPSGASLPVTFLAHFRKGSPPIPLQAWLLAILWVHSAPPSSHPKSKKRLKEKPAWHLKFFWRHPRYMSSQSQQSSLIYTSRVQNPNADPLSVTLLSHSRKRGHNSASVLLFCWYIRKSLCHSAGHTKARKKNHPSVQQRH